VLTHHGRFCFVDDAGPRKQRQLEALQIRRLVGWHIGSLEVHTARWSPKRRSRFNYRDRQETIPQGGLG
jgi:hypothetical protein